MFGPILSNFDLFRPINTTGGFVLALLLCTALFVALFAAMHRLSPQAKKWMTIVCTFIAGLYFVLEYFWPLHLLPDGKQGNFITPTQGPVTDYVNNIFIWFIGLGIISLSYVHGRRLFKRQPGWYNSLAFFLAFFAITVTGFMTQEGQTGAARAQFTYNALFSGLLINLDAAMFALLAFYIASAAYRAFRVRTIEAGMLMFAALIVMLGFVNFGVTLTSWIPEHSQWAFFRMERLSLWLLQYVNMPGQRAVLIGVEIGALAMALRLWLSLERGAFFSQES